MPQISNALKTAIDAGNVMEVRRLLAIRNAYGIPIEDINNVTDNRLIRTGVLFTLLRLESCMEFPTPLSSQVAFQIIDAFLMIYDNTGNPVIDLNVKHGLCINAFEYLLSLYAERKILPDYARLLVDRFINLRRNDGSRACDISHNGHTSPLIQAVLSDDVHIVRTLLDLRNADGSHTIDVNFRMAWGNKCTALDVAYIGSYYDLPPQFTPNDEIITALRAAGAIRANVIEPYPRVLINTPLQRAMPEPIIVLQPPPVRVVFDNQPPPTPPLPTHPTRTDDITVFRNNPQNTHTPEVESSVALSITALKDIYYQKPNWPDFETVRRQIANYLTEVGQRKLFSQKRLADIKKGFAFVVDPKTNIRHIPSYVMTRDILILIWLGANDSSRIVNDSPFMKPEHVNDLRKQALLEKFEAIATTYTDGRGFSCLGGTRNLIVEALNRAHPAVFVAPTRDVLQEMAVEYMKHFLVEQIKKLDLETQRKILNAWVETADTEEKRLADHFRNAQQALLFTFLSAHLGNLLTPQWLKEAEENYLYISAPIPHIQLRKVIESITELSPVVQEDHQAIIGRLKNLAKHIFNDFSRNYDDDHKFLLLYFTLYQLIVGNPSASVRGVEEAVLIDVYAHLLQNDYEYCAVQLNQLLVHQNLDPLIKYKANKLFFAHDELRFGFLREQTITQANLDTLPAGLKSSIISLLFSIESMYRHVSRLYSKKRNTDAISLEQAVWDLQQETARFVKNQQFDERSCAQFVARCHHRINAFEFGNRNTGVVTAFCADILKSIGRALRLPVIIENKICKNGLTFFSNQTTRQQYLAKIEDKLDTITGGLAKT